ncbi:hypothetical protein BKA70DRAFT_1249481, partial [Coprinopsis sp. MPI-PUGE-AT-0042]
MLLYFVILWRFILLSVSFISLRYSFRISRHSRFEKAHGHLSLAWTQIVCRDLENRTISSNTDPQAKEKWSKPSSSNGI